MTAPGPCCIVCDFSGFLLLLQSLPCLVQLTGHMLAWLNSAIIDRPWDWSFLQAPLRGKPFQSFYFTLLGAPRRGVSARKGYTPCATGWDALARELSVVGTVLGSGREAVSQKEGKMGCFGSGDIRLIDQLGSWFMGPPLNPRGFIAASLYATDSEMSWQLSALLGSSYFLLDRGRDMISVGFYNPTDSSWFFFSPFLFLFHPLLHSPLSCSPHLWLILFCVQSVPISYLSLSLHLILNHSPSPPHVFSHIF